MSKPCFGIYIHVPFCMSKCSYCSFVSRCANENEIEKYFSYLYMQINKEGNNFKNKIVTSIYFGGGTPSFVDSKHIAKTMECIKSNFKLDNQCEITIECNPCSITKQKLSDYQSVGINRISFGVQSLHDECLSAIGRKHTAKEALNAIDMAKACGFCNISADLLIGIPNQNVEMLKEDISTLIKSGVKHISSYMLMLEEGTALYDSVCIKKDVCVSSDDDCVNMYNDAYAILKSKGFYRYEISNFAILNYECKHNINYWECGEYVGFGLSASSYYSGKRISGFASFDDYYSYVSTNNPKPEREDLSLTQKIEEYIMLSLRMTKGIDLDHLLLLGYDLKKEKEHIINMYMKNNVIEIKDNHLSICEEMFGTSNQIIINLLP